jgi:hypothetical protein
VKAHEFDAFKMVGTTSSLYTEKVVLGSSEILQGSLLII